jgi:hypothetical protein
MEHARKLMVGFFVLGALALGSGPARADSPGPYYATPSWGQKLQCDTQATCPRFIVLSNWTSEVVLDRETGLGWEKSPQAGVGSDGNDPVTWVDARSICANRNAGGHQERTAPGPLLDAAGATCFNTMKPLSTEELPR